MRVIYNTITKEVVTTTVNDGSITSYPVNTNVIQGDVESIVLQATALGINLSQIPGLNLSPELIRVYSDRAFGQKIFNRFLEENKRVILSTEQNVNQLTSFINLKQLLEAGAIETSRDLLYISPSDAFIIVTPYITSDERKQSYINELNEYLEANNTI